MLRHILIIIQLFGTSLLMSQGFQAGFSVGMNASQIDGDLFSGYNKPGIRAGFLVSYQIRDRFKIGLELAYNELGSQKKLIVGSSSPEEQRKIQLNYLSFPIFAQIQPKSRLNWLSSLNFKFGLENSYMIKSKIQDRDDEEILEYFNNWNLGLLLGVIYEINERIGLEFRINESANLIFNNDKIQQFNSNSLRNRYITFMLKYLL